MSENITLKITTEAWPRYPRLLSIETAGHIIWIFRFAIYPITSIIGICVSLTTIIALARQGLKKSSNVLLLVLAVSDVLYLTGLNNFTEYILTENSPPSFRFSESINYMCYVIHTILSTVVMTGNSCSMAVPVLIAGERLIAIFFPLHVRFIVTPVRTWIVNSVLFILFLGFFIYNNVISVQFYKVANRGVAFGFLLLSPFYHQKINGVWVYGIMRHILNNLTGIVPIILVSLGCVVIGFQVKIISTKRLKLTSSLSQKHSRKS